MIGSVPSVCERNDKTRTCVRSVDWAARCSVATLALRLSTCNALAWRLCRPGAGSARLARRSIYLSLTYLDFVFFCPFVLTLKDVPVYQSLSLEI